MLPWKRSGSSILAMPNRLPLRPGDQEPVVDLQFLLDEIYDNSGYDLKLDYREDPVPPLKPEDAAWLENLLMEQQLR
jgi:hypothetical protein